MGTRHASYSLQRIGSSADASLAAALAIYVHAIPARYRTDTNEIVHWIDHYEASYGDPLLVFSFCVGRELVGFAQMVYFKAEELVVVDYLVIDSRRRRNNVFFEFVDQVRDYFSAHDWPVTWVAAEVALDHSPRPDADGRLLIRLLKLEGFKVVKAPYYQPLLSFNNRESELPAVLLLAGDPGIEQIRRDTFQQIVSTIYIKHYLRWYSNYPAEQQRQRAARIQALEARIDQELKGSKVVKLNGHSSLLRSEARSDQETSAAERNLATNAVTIGMAVLLALGGGALPEPFRYALWAVIALGVAMAVLVWPKRSLRHLLWSDVRIFRRKE